MLEAYLAFARGDSGEQAQPTDMAQALEELRSDAERNGHTATVQFHGLPVVTVRPDVVQALPRQSRLERGAARLRDRDHRPARSPLSDRHRRR